MITEINMDELKTLCEAHGVPMSRALSTDSTGRYAIKMVSEDGTNFLQGLACFELYGLSSGTWARILLAWVAPECRDVGFEMPLVTHAEMYAKRHADRADSGLEGPLRGISSKLAASDPFVSHLAKCGYTVEQQKRGVKAWKNF